VNESLQAGSAAQLDPIASAPPFARHRAGRIVVVASRRRWSLDQELRKSPATSRGFDPKHAMVAELILPKAKYPRRKNIDNFSNELCPTSWLPE